MHKASTNEDMRLERVLHRLLYFIVEAEPQLSLYFKSKVDLEDAYMRIWVRLNYNPSVTLLMTNEKKHKEQLVVFYVSILMGYV